MTERARELLGFEGSYQRYPDLDSVRELQEISDPHTLEDDTQRSVSEWLADNKIKTVAFTLLGVIGIGLILNFAWRYIPLVVGNQWVQLGALLTGVFIVGRKNGWTANQSRVEEIDELELQNLHDETQQSLKGVVLDGGETPMFIPIKGYRKPGMRPTPYKAVELDPSVTDRVNGSVDPDLPAIVRLHPEWTTMSETETGTKAVQQTKGLDADSTTGGKEAGMAVLRAAPPDFAPEEKVRKINEKMQRVATQKKKYKNRIQHLEETIDNLREKANEPVDERADEYLERLERLMYANKGRQPPGDHTNGRDDDRKVTTSGTDDELEQVQEEVSVDD
jgi:hypothetical protein